MVWLKEQSPSPPEWDLVTEPLEVKRVLVITKFWLKLRYQQYNIVHI